MSDVPFTVGARPFVNTITAGPLLNLLLALQGMEGPDDRRRTWEVFQQFARLASSSEHDVVGFHAGWMEVDDGYPTFAGSWVRELTDDAAGFGTLTRAIQVEFGYEEPLESLLEPVELWSDDYPTLEAFFAEVAQLPHFTFIMETAPDFAGVYVREPDGAEDYLPQIDVDA